MYLKLIMKNDFFLNLTHIPWNINNERSYTVFSTIEHLRGLKKGGEEVKM